MKIDCSLVMRSETMDAVVETRFIASKNLVETQ